eukprot:716500-Pyramimonas_sp.AAC.1
MVNEQQYSESSGLSDHSVIQHPTSSGDTSSATSDDDNIASWRRLAGSNRSSCSSGQSPESDERRLTELPNLRSVTGDPSRWRRVRRSPQMKPGGKLLVGQAA